MRLLVPKHPFWKLAELATVGLIMVMIFWLGLVYECPIELKDMIPILAPLLTILGFSLGKAATTGD